MLETRHLLASVQDGVAFSAGGIWSVIDVSTGSYSFSAEGIGDTIVQTLIAKADAEGLVGVGEIHDCQGARGVRRRLRRAARISTR